jgi:hypothetical protein
LGIRVGPVTDEIVRDQRLVVRRGAVIMAIEKGSAADRAGLPLGGVIVAVNGRRIDTPDDMIQAIHAVRPGQDVEVTYYDHDKLARKKVHLAAATTPDAVAVPVPVDPARPGVPPPVGPAPGPAPAGPNLERELGADGSRPLLGRLGRVIDGLTTPPPGQPVVPVDPALPARGDLETEVFTLRQQVAELSKQLDALRKQVAALEKKVSEPK